MQKEEYTSGQKTLKVLYQGQQWVSRIAYGILYLLLVGGFIAFTYYKILGIRGIDTGKQSVVYFQTFLMAAVALACVKLMNAAAGWFRKQDYNFDPLRMELPEPGTVDLEQALHRMSYKTAVIIWDTVFITLLVILLMLMLTLHGNVPRILLMAFGLFLFLAAGHAGFNKHWKKHSFSGEMVQNTEKYIPIEHSQGYAERVEESLKRGILYYAREMILTSDFIIGIVETDISFRPVAIPRSEITEIIFYQKRPVMNRCRKCDMGILKCRLNGGHSVELLIGQDSRMIRVVKVLNYYGIEWKEGSVIYD